MHVVLQGHWGTQLKAGGVSVYITIRCSTGKALGVGKVIKVL